VPPGPIRIKEALAAAACLAISLLLRLWGIAFSPTAPRARPDEEVFLTKGLDYFNGNHALAAEILHAGWPEGYYRIVHGLQWLQAVVLGWVWHSPVNLGCLYAINPGAVELWPRVFSALADVTGCLLVGLIVRRLARGSEQSVALPAGILALGLNYLAARDAHFAVTDSTLLCAICLCLYGAVRAVLDGPRFLVLAAVGVGAGFGVKYAAAPMVVVCAASLALCLVMQQPSPVAPQPSAAQFASRRNVVWWGVASVFAGLLSFVVMSPYALWHPPDFFAGLLGHRGRYTRGALSYLVDSGFHPPFGWHFYLREVIPTAVGWPGVILGIVGLLLLWKRERRAAVVLLAAALANFGTIAFVRAMFVRYAAPAIPPLAVGLGLSLAMAFGWLRDRLSWGPRLLAGGALVAIVFWAPVRLIVQLDRLLSAPDTRDLATEWLLKQGPNSPAVTQGWYSHVRLLEPESVEACRPMIPPWLWREVAVLPAVTSDWADLVKAGKASWGAIGHSAIDQSTGDSPGRPRARFVVDTGGMLPCGREARHDDHAPLELPCYAPVSEIHPGSSTCSGYFDVYDAMWIPFRGFEGQTNPGPRIRIYENYCRKD
jgi:hypothetical protein